ncbi:MAG: hypothetical protein RBT34_01090 [Anaerolineaceae bacterium]|jgi:hypothetical protein|nr:hypothetical protein [Anaerolineaceae bacterium]
MPQKNTFDTLMLLARPAAGKSEIIHYLHNTPLEERINRFHVGEFVEIDDFPMLWAWFEEDRILEEMGMKRLHSTKDEEFNDRRLWDVLIRRISLEHQKLVRDEQNTPTIVIEFSRGSEHGGYKSAFENLSQDVLERLAILYVDVSWEESLRKNRKRFNPERPDSILEHALPDERLQRLYKEIDWEEITAPDPDFIHIQGAEVPYVVFDNQDDVTTARGEALGNRLEEALNDLWALYNG